MIHDAILRDVHVAWTQGSCTIDLSTVHDGEVRLVFVNISRITIPREKPWGPSVSVNTLRESKPGSVEIEVQSGDVICIEAESWRCEAR
jgi:hypothetical protein